jgi:hypothetical protein
MCAFQECTNMTESDELLARWRESLEKFERDKHTDPVTKVQAEFLDLLLEIIEPRVW